MADYKVIARSLFLLFSLTIVRSDSTEDSQKKENATGISRKDLYKYGFQLKRAEQIEGVKRISKMDEYSKKSTMVKLLLEKLFKVMNSARIIVMESGYIPGEEFPENQQQLDALGHVFENVAFFGDLLLRCPDITHKLYDTNSEWKVIMNWGVLFANETGVFEGSQAKFLNLVSQELEIIPREANYLNPYKEATIKAENRAKKKKEEELRREKEEKKQRKTTKKKRKGPRLGGNFGEL